MMNILHNHIKTFLTALLLCICAVTRAQVTGNVTDADNGDAIVAATVAYKEHKMSVKCDRKGNFTIARHNGWVLTISAVGYESKSLEITQELRFPLIVRLKSKSTALNEVTVKSKKSRYSRKNNPAVELMERVIAAKKRTDLANKPYYQYRNYEKMTFAFNDLTQANIDSGFIGKRQWLRNQVEYSERSGKMILPVMLNERVSNYLYSRNPKKERTIVEGERTEGINELFETGELVNTMMKDVFSDIDVYDDQIRLLQMPFTSPIGKDAIAFYRFYIVDTVKVERDSCFHLTFIPNNQQDIGFRGDIFIVKDSSLHVRRVNLTIPQRSDVNLVTNMLVTQEYEKLDNGEWVLSVNDMIVELRFNSFLGKYLVERSSRRYDYSFDPIPDHAFRGKAKEYKTPDAEMQSDRFWTDNRKMALSKSEAHMGEFVNDIHHIEGFPWLSFILKAFIENFIETGINDKPSLVDIGPVNSMFSVNSTDGFRLRTSAQTTANLNPHLFLKGYYAHGFKSKRDYYSSTVTYSFNKKKYLPSEFPMRNISFTTTNDVGSPSDKFMSTDKDNIFTSLKWGESNKMMRYNRQQLSFEREEEYGLRSLFSVKFEKNTAVGDLLFKPLSDYSADNIKYEGGPWEDYYTTEDNSTNNGTFRTTELFFELEYTPGRTYFNTKQRRRATNNDAPTFKISHTLGLSGIAGSKYHYNATELSIYKRFWMNSWGRQNIFLKGGIQWSQVPYPLLIAPAANISYIMSKEAFGLVNNMEFMNDRFLSLNYRWEFYGKILNRIPLVKKLKWREFVGFNALWGGLSDKNNPNIEQNWQSKNLMAFPEGCYVMDTKRPYAEYYVGLSNIFRFFTVAYFHRMNYHYLPTAHKNGVRILFQMSF